MNKARGLLVTLGMHLSMRWIERVYDYRILDGKRAMGLPLSLSEAVYLRELHGRFRGPDSGTKGPADGREQQRIGVHIGAELVVGARSWPAMLRDISANGARVECPAQLAEASQVVIRIDDTLEGKSYRLPGVVVRAAHGELGIELTGLPVAMTTHRGQAAA
jgi:hypothetical protein